VRPLWEQPRIVRGASSPPLPPIPYPPPQAHIVLEQKCPPNNPTPLQGACASMREQARIVVAGGAVVVITEIVLNRAEGSYFPFSPKDLQVGLDLPIFLQIPRMPYLNRPYLLAPRCTICT
jgi:hypothetical protein